MPDLHTLPAPIVPKPGPSQYTAPAGARPVNDADGWIADGCEGAHQAHLDDLGHVNAPDPAGPTWEDMFPRLRHVSVLLGAPQ